MYRIHYKFGMHADTMNYEYSEVNEILLYIRLRYSQVYTVYEGYEYCIDMVSTVAIVSKNNQEMNKMLVQTSKYR